MVKHTPAYRARRKRMRDQRKMRRWHITWSTVPLLDVRITMDTSQIEASISEARELLSRLFAVPERLLQDGAAPRTLEVV